MKHELIFSGFIDKNKEEHASIKIRNLSDKVIFFNDLTPQESYDSFSLKDKNEMLMVEWKLDEVLSEKFLKGLISNYSNRNIFWNLKRDKIQEIGVKDKNILEKMSHEGIFSLLAVENDEMILFQKDLSSGKSKIKTFFSNQNYSYIDLISYFLEDQKKAGFQVSIVSKKIIKIKTVNLFDHKEFLTSPIYITTQTLLDAPRQTISGIFFVIETPKIKDYNFLSPFSHLIVHNHHQEPSFKINNLNIYHIEFFEIEDFFLCSISTNFLNDEENDFEI